MNTTVLKKKKIIAVLMIIVGLPFALAGAAGGGGIMGYVFAGILAIGVDMLVSKD